MPSLGLVYSGSLGISVFASLLLALLLWSKAGQTPGRMPLVLFCLGIGIWVLGHWIVAWGGRGSLPPVQVGIALISLAPVVAAIYVHFAFRFSRDSKRATNRWLWACYAAALAVSLTAMILQSGTIAGWLIFENFYYYSGFAWVAAGLTLILSGIGHWLLLRRYRSAGGKYRRQLLAILCSGLWGLFASSGLMHASLGLDQYPYQIVLLPGYTFLLVYGILRYELMDLNRWFRLGLSWFLLLAVISLAVTLFITILVSFGLTQLHARSVAILWSGALLGFVIAYALYPALQKLATRWVYPGAELDATRLDHWRDQLQHTKSWSQFKTCAEKLFRDHVQQPVAIEMGQTEGVVRDRPDPAAFRFICEQNAGSWHCETDSESPMWSASTPGMRFSGEVFASLLSAGANQLQQALALADERAKQLQHQHLTELGQLSASIAHELRNPLNIIAMANATEPANENQEIRAQLERAQQLVTELLDYSASMELQRQNEPLRAVCMTVLSLYLSRHNQDSERPIEFVVDIHEDLMIYSDVHRLQQVLVNLIENAIAAVADVGDPVISIRAEDSGRGVRIRVCDNGCGISPERGTSIFQPFCSGNTKGTGLGLAIVKRIVDAHSGTIEYKPLDPQSGQWFSSCFEVLFPGPS